MRRFMFSLILLLGCWFSVAPAAAAEGSWPVVAAARRALPSVVGIINLWQPPGAELKPRGTGSGVIYRADGVIVTNDHVVRGAKALRVVLFNGREYAATILGEDPFSDLAVIHIAAHGLTPATWFPTARVEVGELAVAIGNPLGLGFARTVTAGVVSGVNRTLGHGYAQYAFHLIQTDAAINPGNSGGALVNKDGQVLGINSVKIITPGFEGMGFAIPADTVRSVVQAILEHGRVIRPWLGIGVLASASASEPSLGLTVQQVFPHSPAEMASLKPGDIVTAVEGQPIHTLIDLMQALARHRIGERVVINVLRNGLKQRIQLRLQEMPANP